jgi:hypothetical protein
MKMQKKNYLSFFRGDTISKNDRIPNKSEQVGERKQRNQGVSYKINPKNAVAEITRQACMQKNLSYRHLCKTFDFQST